MSRHKTTKITVETEKVLVIRKHQVATASWCSTCLNESPMISAEQSAALTGLSRRKIYRMAEAGSLHFTETADGRLLICLLSLRQQESAWISAEQNH